MLGGLSIATGKIGSFHCITPLQVCLRTINAPSRHLAATHDPSEGVNATVLGKPRFNFLISVEISHLVT
ncbi:hypothetical protein BSLA_01r2283 [Burkholderia stabilis]|nr:hypothetical protein BSLA_01r2283 [Burkholderia stabilis]